MNLLRKYDSWIAALMMISFFLPIRMQVLLLIPSFVFFFIRDLVENKERSFLHFQFPIILSGGYLLYLIYLPFTPKSYQAYIHAQLETRASLLLFPFIFWQLKNETKTIIFYSIYWFAIICFLSCFIGNVACLLRSENLSNHVHYRLFFESITGVHPTYMGMYLCFAISWLLLNEEWRENIRGWLVGVIFCCYFIFLLALMPKTPIIAMVIILVIFFLKKNEQKQLLMQVSIAFAMALLIAILLLPFSLQRMEEITVFSSSSITKTVVDNSINMRQLIWKIDVGLLKKYWLLGCGAGQLQIVLLALYNYYSSVMGIRLGCYDTHNEYLHQWISFGLLGFIIFIFGLMIQYRKALKQQNELYLFLLLISSLTFLTENVLANQHGVVFFAFFTSIFFFKNNG